MSKHIAARYTVAESRLRALVAALLGRYRAQDGMETIEMALWAGAIVIIATALVVVFKAFIAKSTGGL